MLARDFTPGYAGPGPTENPLSSQFLFPFIPFGPDRLIVDTGDYGASTLHVIDAANNDVPIISGITLTSRPDEGGRFAYPAWAMLDDGTLVFSARNTGPNSDPVDLYRTDGTPQGTYKLGPINLNPRNTYLGHLGSPELVSDGRYVYFAAVERQGVIHGTELWRTDGTIAGTTLFKDVAPGPPSGLVSPFGPPYFGPSLATAGGRVYFRAWAAPLTTPLQLWASDGTPDGTAPIFDGSGPSFANFNGVGSKLFFTSASGSIANALWTTDGTAAGTAPVPRDVAVLSPMHVFNGAAYFIGSETGGAQAALFRSDGTADGTFALGGSGMTLPDEWESAGNNLYVVSGGDLWKTDGTAAGTLRLLSPPRQAGVSTLGPLAAVGDELYFAAFDPEHGQELWKTDGTVEGTAIAEDVWAGATGSDPRWLTSVGGTLFFAATDPANGRELRRLDVHTRVVARHVGSADNNLIAALPGQAGSSANVTGDERGITRVLIDAFALPDGKSPGTDDVGLDILVNGQWTALPAPAQVELLRGAGAGGSDRLAVTLPDGAVMNTWLRVTLRPTAATGLSRADVFFFGSLAGDTGGADVPAVDARDLATVRRNLFSSNPAILSRLDFNRDGVVNLIDLMLARTNQRHRLPPLATADTEPPPPAPPAAAAPAYRASLRGTRRAKYI